jgi:2-polyprenyl-6-methoxyphenol hydroxylase-like FAD-dependent oxidoreductase
MQASTLPILIVGGGLGGLTTALALGQKGWPVHVLEQAPEIEPIGFGIQLGPNVFSMLDRLGVAEAVQSVSHFPSAILMFDAVTGEEQARIPCGPELRARFKHPYVVIHRVDLHQILLDACERLPNITLAASTTVTGFEDLGDRVRAGIQDGAPIEGAAIIGADGLRSRLRNQLFDEGEPNMIGYVAHRSVVPMAKVPKDVQRDEVVLWAGPGFHIVHYPLRRGELFNLVAVFRTPTYTQKFDAAACIREVEQNYRTAHPAMKTLLSLMDFERRWIISDRDPIRTWSRGRATLLGDAAHPTLQSLAQGACMAIEDALCLAELIELSQGDYEPAFVQYQAERLVRTARVQLESRYLWDVYHAEDIARDVRRQTFLTRSGQDYYDCLAWLWDGFALPTELRGREAARDSAARTKLRA